VLGRARALGFDVAGLLPIGSPMHGDAFRAWLAAGYHGEMAYLSERAAERADPARLAADTRSMVLVAANYNPGFLPPDSNGPGRGRIARFAWTADYHQAIKAALYELDASVRALSGRRTQGKVCVDTAPLLERDFAAQAGLGFIGRNTCLITPGLGSWTFLAALLVPEECGEALMAEPALFRTGVLPAQLARKTGGQRRPLASSTFVGCGRCTRCLDACPTRAFPSPYVLDARRCISYLTIEMRGPIPWEMRPLMGNWVFGCDLCQEVCPYNRTAPAAAWPALAPDGERGAPSLLDLLSLDEAGFRARFRGTSILRSKRSGLVRNACVAAGNWGEPAAVPALIRLLGDPESLVRGHAAWALGRVGGADAARALQAAFATELDAYVRSEIRFAAAP
jgi:epoxyqueuosine reductase